MSVLWTDLADENKYLESEELLLRNTFVNAKPKQKVDLNGPNNRVKRTVLRWTDIETNGFRPLAEEDADENDLINKVKPARVTQHHTIKASQLKPAIRAPRDSSHVLAPYPSKVFDKRYGFLVNFEPKL